MDSHKVYGSSLKKSGRSNLSKKLNSVTFDDPILSENEIPDYLHINSNTKAHNSGNSTLNVDGHFHPLYHPLLTLNSTLANL